MKWLFALFAVLASGAYADYSVVSLAPGDVATGGAGKAVALSAISTNKTGTLTVKRVTPLALSWTENRTTATTNFTYQTEAYRAFASNVVSVVTNAAGTMTLTNAFYRTAYRVVTNATVTTSTVAVPRSYYAAKTNDLCALTLSGGAATTNFTGSLILPGDFLLVTGTALPGGNASLIIER